MSRVETQQRRKEKRCGWLLPEKWEHSDCLLQEEREHVLEQPEDVCGFCSTLSLSNIHKVGPRVWSGLFHNNNFLISFSGVKSHNLLRIERWKRFGATIVRGLLLHTLGFEARGNMFVVEGPGSKELLSNWGKDLVQRDIKRCTGQPRT